MRIGVLISGYGTNLQAIIDASESGRLMPTWLSSSRNRDAVRGLARAKEHGIPGVFVDRGASLSSRAYNERIRDILQDHLVDYVVMAGYMRLLGKEVLDVFPDRVINLHPTLLPSFAGASGIRDAFDYGVKVTGVTVHFANEEFDEGPIIAQEALVVTEDDTAGSLEGRIHAVEHELLPRVLQLIAQGRVEVIGRKVRIHPA